jgi:glycerol uptake facilitator-like aquaporin
MNRAPRAVFAEALGACALLAVVVGSGIMAERLSSTNAGVALLANALATGFALYVLITVLAPISGAHVNPVVTLEACLRGDLRIAQALSYMAAQWIGAALGVWLAHAMFGLPILQVSDHPRSSFGEYLSEAVATAGLLLTITGFVRSAPTQVPAAVGAYIAAAYWFTASTSFANPAVTTARALTDTFAGIAPADALPFIAAQLVGLGAALAIGRVLFARRP